MSKLDKQKLISEIIGKGVQISSINDLMKINHKYTDLVPILLKHLKEITDEVDKEFIVRCLGVKGFFEATKPLMEEFYNSSKITYKWAIGNTLAIIEDANFIDEYIRIVKDKKHGISRQMIVESLGKFKNPKVVQILIELLQDQDVAGHAISALSNFKKLEIIPHLEPFLNHKTAWIKREAIKAIKKIKKSDTKRK